MITSMAGYGVLPGCFFFLKYGMIRGGTVGGMAQWCCFPAGGGDERAHDDMSLVRDARSITVCDGFG